MEVPHVETLSDYLRLTEGAIVLESPIANGLESILVFDNGQWILIINSADAQPGELQDTSETS